MLGELPRGQAVADYLRAGLRPVVWYQVDRSYADIASFFHFMGQAIRHGAQGRCLSPLQRFAPKHLPDIDEFAELAHNNFFITRQHVSPEGVYRYHQLFRDFLLSQARETCGDDRRGRMLVVMIWKGAATMLIRIQYHDKSEGAVDGTQLQGLIACGEILAFRRASGWVVLGQDPVRQEHADRRCPTSLLNLYI